MQQNAFHPIIYVRGYAMTQGEIENTVADPYMGFNIGSCKVRQLWNGTVKKYFFESPLVRLLKQFGYDDVYEDGADRVADARALDPAEDVLPVPYRSIVIYRYYEPSSEDLGTGQKPDMKRFATGLGQLILDLRDRIYWGFDQGVYYGTVNSAFVRAAKLEGFMVAIYTILDPDTMVRNAAAGVDYMETDFPRIMNSIQPARFTAASGPTPTNAASSILLSPMLTWVVASNTTAHRVYFGTATNPPFVREQALDVVYLSNLLSSTTYYWRIDEVTPSGVVTGAVWNFTTVTTPPPTNAVYEWTFDGGNLNATLGKGTLTYADATTASVTTFGNTDGTIPHIGGQPASYMHVPVFNAKGNGYFVRLLETGPNGGGAYINQYSVIIDLFVPTPLNWTALFNTDPENNNDADWYVAGDGSVGIGALGYTAAGAVAPGTWYRLAFVADLGAGVVTYYKNGAQVFQRTGATLLEGRYALYSTNDTLPSLLLFNEGDTSGNYTHELYTASIAVVDRPLSAGEVAALGAPNAEGIFVRRLRVTHDGENVTLNWNGAPTLGLQKSSSLSPPSWQNVPGTLGTSSYSEPASTNTFYRLIWQN